MSVCFPFHSFPFILRLPILKFNFLSFRWWFQTKKRRYKWRRISTLDEQQRNWFYNLEYKKPPIWRALFQFKYRWVWCLINMHIDLELVRRTRFHFEKCCFFILFVSFFLFQGIRRDSNGPLVDLFNNFLWKFCCNLSDFLIRL